MTRPATSEPVLTPRVLVIGAIICIVLFGLWQIGMAIQAHNEQVAAVAAAQAAAKAEQERQQRLAATLARLSLANPGYHYALYPGDNGTVTFNAQFDKSTVRTVGFSRSADLYSVTVTLYGSQMDNQAPKVDVSVLDENGTILARKAIVDFVDADLALVKRVL